MDKITVKDITSKTRIDKYLSNIYSDKSRSFLSSLIDENKVFVNDKNVKSSYIVKNGDVISIEFPLLKQLDVKKEEIPLDIIFEDDDILVINKPQGMVVHPSNGHSEHTLVNALLNHCQNLSGINGIIRPGIVHRIDKDTSGLLVVAKSDKAHHFLSNKLKTHDVKRVYIALCKGVIKENSGTIDIPLGRDSRNRKLIGVDPKNGKVAITNFKVLQRFENHTLVQCELLTGRTHQIRVHMAYINHPIEGDPLYSGKHYKKLYSNGQLLCATKLSFIHPINGKMMEFEIELPKYFKDIIDTLSTK